MTLKTKPTESKTDKMTIKSKIFWSVVDIVKRRKSQSTLKANVHKSYTQQGIVSRLHKEISKLNSRKKKTFFYMCEPWIKMSLKRICESLSHLQLCNPKDWSLPGYSVHGILQARILEWVAMPFSRASSQPRDRIQLSRIAGGFFTTWATKEAQKGYKNGK